MFPLFLRYHGAISKVRALLAKPNDDPPFICVLLGESGAGKSELVKQFCQPFYRFSSVDGWWDSYDGERTIFIDDCDGSSMQYRLMLQVLSSGCPRLKTKGGFVQPYIEEIYITTNVHPIHWYSAKATAKPNWDLLHPLCRRLEQYGELRIVPPWSPERFWPPVPLVASFRDPEHYHFGRRDFLPGDAMRRPRIPEDLFGLNMALE